MDKKLSWSLGLGLVGLCVAQKHTYWMPGTYLRDARTSAIAMIGCAAAGFLLGFIITKTPSERQRKLKVLSWLAVMGIFGSFLGIGKGVPLNTTLTVFAWILSVGLVIGILQYLLHQRNT